MLSISSSLIILLRCTNLFPENKLFLQPGSNSFLNSNKMLHFDSQADKTSLWNRTKLGNDVKKQAKTNLTTSQLVSAVYLNYWTS